MGQRLVVEGHKVYKRPYFRILTKMPNNVDYIHRVRDSVGLLEADSQKFYTRKIGYSSDSQKIKIYEKVVSKNKADNSVCVEILDYYEHNKPIRITNSNRYSSSRYI